ncbi:hypothetical protein RPALISO_163 [Ruegeria phage RpAliso]|nr:hypothetical protein RPALISO_163 [Ruegeria phage RpAliso]
MHNTSQPKNPDMKIFTTNTEFLAYDLMPEDIRAVLRDAPFNVSAADMRDNPLVMEALRERGAGWLKEQLEQTYREKIVPPAMGGMAPPPSAAF